MRSEGVERTLTSVSPIPCNFLKRATDVILSVLFLLVLFPLFVTIAFLIKVSGWFREEDRGPILRYEVRVSEGRPFHFYKFRIIRQQFLDAERDIRRRDRAKTMERDEYCTRVGRWMKKCYLDELPQAYNILRGDMSWVGPRPFPVDDYEEDLLKGDTRKKVIRAGLTGLVQIHKGARDRRDDVELDQEYIRKVRAMGSLRQWFYDLGILLKTFRVFFQAKGL